MANWRRGFFRLWILLTVLWLVLVGAIALPAYLNPVLPNSYFTITDRAELETVEPYSERYFALAADVDRGFIQRATVDDELAPNVFFFAPNDINVDVGGQTYHARVTTENLEPSARDALIDSLVSFIASKRSEPQDLVALRFEVAAAVPPKPKPRWVTPEIGERVKEYGLKVRQEAVETTRRAQISFLFWYGAFPPLLLLVLGASIGWVLTGFRRKEQAR